MKDKFEGKVSDTEKHETEDNHEFMMLKQDLDNQKATAESARAANERQRSDGESVHATLFQCLLSLSERERVPVIARAFRMISSVAFGTTADAMQMSSLLVR